MSAREDLLASDEASPAAATQLAPVLPLRDLCLFPGASLTLTLDQPATTTAVEIAARTGGTLLALARREGTVGPRDLHSVGTLALVRECDRISPVEQRLELDGLSRALVRQLIGGDVLVAEVATLLEGDEADEWGPAVEALARYLHTHQELRTFLEQQRRSEAPMSWVNLACQHLPITGSARQRLLEANAPERCLKISRGLDALLRKEQGA
jgi:ATP-dependent Lon protease